MLGGNNLEKFKMKVKVKMKMLKKNSELFMTCSQTILCYFLRGAYYDLTLKILSWFSC